MSQSHHRIDAHGTSSGYPSRERARRVDRPVTVECEQASLKHGYDEKKREFRIRLKAEADTDVIVNIRF